MPIIEAINKGRSIVRQEMEILKRLELIKSHLDPQDVKHEKITEAINQGRDRVKGNHEILEYFRLIENYRGINGGYIPEIHTYGGAE